MKILDTWLGDSAFEIVDIGIGLGVPLRWVVDVYSILGVLATVGGVALEQGLLFINWSPVFKGVEVLLLVGDITAKFVSISLYSKTFNKLTLCHLRRFLVVNYVILPFFCVVFLVRLNLVACVHILWIIGHFISSA